MNFIKRRALASILIPFLLLLGGARSMGQITLSEKTLDQGIHYDEIIGQGLRFFEEDQGNQFWTMRTLEAWYTVHPLIEFASLIKNTLTIKFVDGTYTLLMNPSSSGIDDSIRKKAPTFISASLSARYDSGPSSAKYNNGQTALILNPVEYLYGDRVCQKIMNNLETVGYTVIYKTDDEIDLTYIEDNLSASIIYMNTHAGYWDINGDTTPDVVVIGTGEPWTDETAHRHQFEYDNNMIVRGQVGDHSFVAFTPTLIDHYYQPDEFPDSLIYMATCHATYDDSMAEAFLDTGARSYMGWTQNTVFWTNSVTSVWVFRLLCHGFTVNQVCRLIRSGGLLNFFFRSALTYYGDGSHRITTKTALSSSVS